MALPAAEIQGEFAVLGRDAFPRSERASGSRTKAVLLIVAIFVCVAAAATLRLFPAEEDAGLEEKLDALGYLEWVEGADASRRGVVDWDATASAAGLNLYTTHDRVVLMEMDGSFVNVWERPPDEGPWHTASLAPWGALLVVGVNRDLLALDWDGGVLWRYQANAHHDVQIDDAGRIYLLTRGVESLAHDGRELQAVTDYIDVLTQSGERLTQTPLHEIFADRVSAERWAGIAAGQGNQRLSRDGRRAWLVDLELFHTNSLRILDRDVGDVARRGDVLLSLRFLDTIAIVDLQQRRTRWSWGPGHLEDQHDAQLLDDDTILLFDNGTRRRFSRVIQVDPQTDRIVWEYRGDPPESFFSAQRGAAQRLANGNTLITNSDSGYTFEITPDGRRVWEYHEPEIRELEPGKEPLRRGIYRMRRLGRPYVELARKRGLGGD